MTLVLASASPRRSEILGALGFDFEVVPSRFDEGGLVGLSPRVHAAAAAEGKAAAVRRDRPGDWVLGADTVVAIDGQILGKPYDAGAAAGMLRRLAGRSHSVITAVHVASPRGDAAGAGISRVRFQPLSEAQIQAYVAGGEPFDKAGGYGIQGEGGGLAALERGRLDTVVGLPSHVLGKLLRGLGCPYFANLGRLR